MLKEYRTVVSPLKGNEREALRAKLADNMAGVVVDEGKAMSAAARLKRAEKQMLRAVSYSFYLEFQAEIPVWI